LYFLLYYQFVNKINLDDEQVEAAADAMHRVRSCGPSPQVSCNKADAV